MAQIDPTGTVQLIFSEGTEKWQASAKKIAGSVSALVHSGRSLWVCSDQTASVERLTAGDATDPIVYKDHQSFRLGDLVTLPQHDDTEVDLEGMDIHWLSPGTGYLWLVGSHSRARQKPDEDASAEEVREALEIVDIDQNRCVLIRVPLTGEGDALPDLVASCPDPADPSGTLRAGVLEELADAIAVDPHLGPFAAIPGKDNGLDVEGLAVAGDRIYVGLRGPVLRGWAVVLEVRVESNGSLDTGEKLSLRRWPGGVAIRKHFLDLAGLGVRELNVDGDDLLVLAGPTMVLDGPVRMLRWIGGATDLGKGAVVTGEANLQVVAELPYGEGDDHAEGFTRLTSDGASSLLVAYDSPADDRRPNRGEVLTDLFPWPVTNN